MYFNPRHKTVRVSTLIGVRNGADNEVSSKWLVCHISTEEVQHPSFSLDVDDARLPPYIPKEHVHNRGTG